MRHSSLPPLKNGDHIQQQFQGRRSKDHAVKAVQHAAVAHEELSIVLDAEFPLDIGKRQITELGYDAQGNAQQGQREIIGLQIKAELAQRAEEHAARVAETARLEEERKQKLAGIDAELEEHRRQVIAQAEERGRRIVAEAEERARGELEENRRRMEKERAACMAGAGDEIADMVVRSAEKLLASKSSAESDRALYDEFLKGIGGGNDK